MSERMLTNKQHGGGYTVAMRTHFTPGIILLFVAGLVVGALATRFVIGGDEDTWLCTESGWQMHGRPMMGMPNYPCGTTANNNTPHDNTMTQADVVSRKRTAIIRDFPAFKEFEGSSGFAGHHVDIVENGSDHYFVYETLGSGVPIAQATCFRVDRSMRVFKVGEFPDPVDSVTGYASIDPITCTGE